MVDFHFIYTYDDVREYIKKKVMYIESKERSRDTYI